MICYLPENTNIDRGKPRSVFAFYCGYHIIFNGSIANNCFIIKHFQKFEAKSYPSVVY